MLVVHNSALSKAWKGIESCTIIGHPWQYLRCISFMLPELSSLGLHVTTVVKRAVVLEEQLGVGG